MEKAVVHFHPDHSHCAQFLGSKYCKELKKMFFHSVSEVDFLVIIEG